MKIRLLFSPTFKVEENKVHLFFRSEDIQSRHWPKNYLSEQVFRPNFSTNSEQKLDIFQDNFRAKNILNPKMSKCHPHSPGCPHVNQGWLWVNPADLGVALGEPGVAALGDPV